MLFLYPIFFILPAMASARMDCSKEAYGQCIRIADPLVKKPHLIFPDNMDDIDLVCHTWDRFVDCLKYYTDNCFTEQQRRQFNKAVENPIENVHQMCTQSDYQKEYLQYARCIKSTITEPAHCGSDYGLLVDQVSQGDIISKSTLCCSHDRFKQCVLRETRRLCDGAALRFSSHLIDKALSFLQDQCHNYIPNSGDCTTLTTDAQAFSDPLTISTSSSEVSPWSTVQDMAGKEMLPSRMTPPRMSPTPSWLPSSSVPETASTQMLGSRSRPVSFGRASSWGDSPSPPPASNTVQMYPQASSTQSSRPDWATTGSWTPQRQNDVETSSVVWYPVAGTQIHNEVDEPNQQGLTKTKYSPGNEGMRHGLVMGLIAGAVIFVVLC